MNLDIALQIASILLTVLLAGIGVEMANNPPAKDDRNLKWRYRAAFILTGACLIGITYWSGKRNTDEQSKTKTENETRIASLEQGFHRDLQSQLEQQKRELLASFKAEAKTPSEHAFVNRVTNGPPGFEQAYAKHKNELGNSVSTVQSGGNVTYTVYERAKEIWLSNPLKHYYLYDNYTWDERSQPPEWTGNGWLDDETLRKKFPETPPQKYPPFGGTAQWWFDDPKVWEAKLGWRTWHCEVEQKTEAHYQQFDQGMIIGVLPVSKGNPYDQQSQIFTLIKNSRWYRDDVPVKGDAVPRCGFNRGLEEK